MIVPTIHLNGTSREELCGQLRYAGIALEGAIQAMREATPHGRDYYPQGEDALRQARAEHHDRLNRLMTVHSEIIELWTRIA